MHLALSPVLHLTPELEYVALELELEVAARVVPMVTLSPSTGSRN